MVKKEIIRKNVKENKIEMLEKEIALKGKEIEQLQKSVAEMAQIHEEEKNIENRDASKTVDSLLNFSFGTLSGSDATKGEKARGLLGLVKEVSKLAEKAQGTQTTQKTINFGKGGVVDFRVSSRPINASPSTQSASRLKIRKSVQQSSRARPSQPLLTGAIKEREPIVDIFEEGDYLHVMAELLNFKEDEISLTIEGNILIVNCSNSAKSYCKKVELPTGVEKEIVESRYHNGILEVKLKKL